MTPSLARWRLTLHGNPVFSGPNGPERLDERTLMLLAYLALEGPQPKHKLAALLWPDATESTARSNLRQTLHRLRRLTELSLVGADESLDLAGKIEVDSSLASTLAAQPLLESIQLDGCPELRAWLDEKRDHHQQTCVRQLLAEAKAFEKGGLLTEAIAQTQKALGLDRTSELAYRQLMSLHYLNGDRAAALAAFETCRKALREALAVEPTSQTLELSQEISRGRRVPARTQAEGLPTTLTMARPPQLVGREQEWALMEQAWAENKHIILSGAAGTGKTRLMQDFLNTHSKPMLFSGRPTDASVPYGTHARTYGELVALIGGPAVLPTWVQKELARIVPGLGDGPGPMESAAEQLRFWQAKAESLRMAFRLGYDSIGFDDLQFVDAASILAGAYILPMLMASAEGAMHTIHCFRSNELSPEVLAMLKRNEDEGIAVIIEVRPLEAQAVSQLLESLGMPELNQMAAPMAHYTGGNPLFVIETVKHLVETKAVQSGFPQKLPPPGRMGRILQRRLERLSPPALYLARALAVLGPDFTLARAAQLTEMEMGSLIQHWDELTSSQLIVQQHFSHDLILEAVLAGISLPVRTLLHHRAAEILTQAGVAPGRIAAHWASSGNDEQARLMREKAEEVARGSLIREDAAKFFQHSSK